MEKTKNLILQFMIFKFKQILGIKFDAFSLK